MDLGLSDRLRRLAHRFLQNGDLYGFLQAVNDDYQRYEDEQAEILRREDEMAQTFVSKVLQARDVQHQEGWRNFLDAVNERPGSTSAATGTRASTAEFVAPPPPSAATGTSAGFMDDRVEVPGPRLRRLVESGLEIYSKAEAKARESLAARGASKRGGKGQGREAKEEE